MLETGQKTFENAIDARLKSIESFMKKTAAEKEICSSENAKHQNEFTAARILAETSIIKLEACEKMNDETRNQITFIKQIYEKLDASRNETCASKTEELQNTLHMKLH